MILVNVQQDLEKDVLQKIVIVKTSFYEQLITEVTLFKAQELFTKRKHLVILFTKTIYMAIVFCQFIFRIFPKIFFKSFVFFVEETTLTYFAKNV